MYLKYALFGEQPTVLATLQAFAENYKRVLSGLKAVWAHIQDEEPATAKVQDCLVKANEALRAAAGLGAHFFRKDPSQAREPPNPLDKRIMCQHCHRDVLVEAEDRDCRCGHCGTTMSHKNYAALRQRRLENLRQQQRNYGQAEPNMKVD